MRDRLARVFGSSESFKDSLINAGIMAGYTFFTTLLAAYSQTNDLKSSAIIAGINAGVVFFSKLAIDRGLLSVRRTET